jgi:hypothetical protein
LPPPLANQPDIFRLNIGGGMNEKDCIDIQLNHGCWIIGGDDNDAFSVGGEINYLHQLQNLYFTLTGKELKDFQTIEKK